MPLNDLPTILNSLVSQCEPLCEAHHLKLEMQMAKKALHAGNKSRMFDVLKHLVFALHAEGITVAHVSSLPEAEHALVMGGIKLPWSGQS